MLRLFDLLTSYHGITRFASNFFLSRAEYGAFIPLVPWSTLAVDGRMWDRHFSHRSRSRGTPSVFPRDFTKS